MYHDNIERSTIKSRQKRIKYKKTINIFNCYKQKLFSRANSTQKVEKLKFLLRLRVVSLRAFTTPCFLIRDKFRHLGSKTLPVSTEEFQTKVDLKAHDSNIQS